MSRRRLKADGLPFRLYERRGARIYSIGHKGSDGRWTFRLSCSVSNKADVSALRREAMTRVAQIEDGRPSEDSFAALLDT